MLICGTLYVVDFVTMDQYQVSMALDGGVLYGTYYIRTKEVA
jgi:hypothetical protein